jgi:branched-chain amino acid transport system permease protein
MPAVIEEQNPSKTEAKDASVLDRPADLGLSRRRLLRGLIVAVVVLVVGLQVPTFVDDPYYMGVIADGTVLGILAISIGFLIRLSGLISLGHTAFYGGAAYALAIAMNQWDWGPMQAAVFGILGGTLLAVVIGSMAIRITGFGFLMLTLAFGQALYAASVLTSLRDVTGAFDGLGIDWPSDATFFGLEQSDVGASDTFWPLAWVAIVVVAVVLWIAGRSRFGVLLEAIRENEERARFSGYNTYLPRLAAFTLSGACASVAGVLFALKASYVSPNTLGFLTAGDSLIATLVGGFTTLAGPAIGALLYIYAQGEFAESGNLQLYTGLALVIAVVFLPGGISGFVVDLFQRVRGRLTGKGGKA